MHSPGADSNDPADLARDDVYAGKMLGIMLSLFFTYTVITGIYVIWWTWDGIQTSVFPR